MTDTSAAAIESIDLHAEHARIRRDHEQWYHENRMFDVPMYEWTESKVAIHRLLDLLSALQPRPLETDPEIEALRKYIERGSSWPVDLGKSTVQIAQESVANMAVRAYDRLAQEYAKLKHDLDWMSACHDKGQEIISEQAREAVRLQQQIADTTRQRDQYREYFDAQVDKAEKLEQQIAEMRPREVKANIYVDELRSLAENAQHIKYRLDNDPTWDDVKNLLEHINELRTALARCQPAAKGEK